jgi:hypothetical protein
MAKYGITIYRTDVYGPDPGLDFSVSPIELTVLDFNAVQVIWQQSAGSYSMARLLRSQTSFPETVDDGEVVWQQSSLDGSAISLSLNQLIDGRDNLDNVTLVAGKPVFYRMFLFDTESKQWLKAGDARSLIPSNHTLHNQMMSWIPRVYTSADQNPIGIVDESSDLYRFLEGFSFTAEELLTYVDILQPTLSQDSYTHVPRVELERASLGLLPEPTLPIKNQRTLIREARYLYSRKGTALGVAGYVEALTGFAPVVTADPNLLLSNQDATFYLGTGNWDLSAGTLTSVDNAASLTSLVALEPNMIDQTYFGRAVTVSAGEELTLGILGSVTEKIPLVPGTTYGLSFYYKSAAGKDVTPKVTLFDQEGTVLEEIVGTAAASATWAKASVEDILASKAVSEPIVFAEADGDKIIYSTLEASRLYVGAVINITGFIDADFNLEDAVVAEILEDGFTVTSSLAETFESPTSAVASTVWQGYDAVYAGITFELEESGTYDFDMVCFAPGEIGDYTEARAINIVLEPYKTNYIKNPSFETDITSGIPEWELDGADATQDSDVPPFISSGDYSLNLDAEGLWELASNRVPVVTGQYWTASMYYKSDEDITLAIVKRNADEEIVEDNFVLFPATEDWTRVSVTSIVDCECTSATLEVKISGEAGEFLVDGIQLEKSFKMTEYYDGSYSFESGAEWADVDAPHESYTYVYPGKPLKLSRLVSTIDDWIPKHLFWRINSLSQVEAASIVE